MLLRLVSLLLVYCSLNPEWMLWCSGVIFNAFLSCAYVLTHVLTQSTLFPFLSVCVCVFTKVVILCACKHHKVGPLHSHGAEEEQY